MPRSAVKVLVLCMTDKQGEVMDKRVHFTLVQHCLPITAMTFTKWQQKWPSYSSLLLQMQANCLLGLSDCSNLLLKYCKLKCIGMSPFTIQCKEINIVNLHNSVVINCLCVVNERKNFFQ